MNRYTATLSLLVLVTMGSGCAQSGSAGPELHGQRDPALRALHWLEGSWVSVAEDGTITEEHWTPAAGGTMFGVGRTLRSGETVFFEYLRIELKDGVATYHAAPGGRQSIAFAASSVPSDGYRVTFENPEHDYPTRITYWIDDQDRLHARIEGSQRGREMASEWVMQRGYGVVARH